MGTEKRKRKMKIVICVKKCSGTLEGNLEDLREGSDVMKFVF